jgi:hypothetical protein
MEWMMRRKNKSSYHMEVCGTLSMHLSKKLNMLNCRNSRDGGIGVKTLGENIHF